MLRLAKASGGIIFVEVGDTKRASRCVCVERASGRLHRHGCYTVQPLVDIGRATAARRYARDGEGRAVTRGLARSGRNGELSVVRLGAREYSQYECHEYRQDQREFDKR